LLFFDPFVIKMKEMKGYFCIGEELSL
jgi:hypothetical protein